MSLLHKNIDLGKIEVRDYFGSEIIDIYVRNNSKRASEWSSISFRSFGDALNKDIWKDKIFNTVGILLHPKSDKEWSIVEKELNELITNAI
ncbi:MAG: hypothetical protein ACRCZB_05575 [Bacteroidales bacterium]